MALRHIASLSVRFNPALGKEAQMARYVPQARPRMIATAFLGPVSAGERIACRRAMA